VGALATAAVLALTACGSGSDSNSASGSSGSAAKSSGPALTGTPISIGVISSLSGPQASSSNQADTVAPAWGEWVNANGGLNGHPVKIISVDDGGDPAKAQAAATKLVDEDKVAVILVGSDNLVPAYDQNVIGKGVPLVSGTANSADWYSKAGMFPTVTDTVSGQATQLLVAQKYGHAKKFGDLYCAEIAACANGTKIQEPIAAKLGLGFTSLAVSSTATSYTAQCLQLQQDKVDYVQMNFSTAAAAKFVQDCQAQGYNPTWGTSGQAVGKDLLSIPDATFYGPDFAFPSVADTAGAKTFRDAMKSYAKDDNWHEGTAGFAWSGLEVLRKALAKAGDQVTPQDVTTALNTISNEDLDGLLANKITFTTGQPTAYGSHPCAFVISIKDGKTQAPKGTVCASA
jgi:branched-chain amino acid transport system substrate-binding protein